MSKILYKMDELAKSPNTPGKFDFYIVAINDKEKRSAEAIKKLSNKDIHIKTLLIVDYFGEEEKLKAEIVKKFPKYKNYVQIINVDKYNTLDCINKVKDVFDETILEDDSIGIDITCFSIPHFFLILKNGYKDHSAIGIGEQIKQARTSLSKITGSQNRRFNR